MYVRTKDGRILDFDKLNEVSKLSIDMAKEPIREAKTIEKLCDCFVIEWLPTNHKDIFTIDEYSKEVVKSCIGNSKTKVYGAIWTDKGLIYVAKMNSTGELELI